MEVSRFTLPIPLNIPLLDQIVPGGFSYGGNYLVEFEPDSPWYEMSLTLTADALRHGIRTEYHTFMHVPKDVKDDISRLGLNPKTEEEKGMFRIADSYTPLTGLPLPREPGRDSWLASTLDPREHSSFLSEMTAGIVKLLAQGVPESEKRWVHVDDNASIFNLRFREEEIINVFQNRIIPLQRLRENAAFHSLVKGIASPSFHKQFESMCDGIIDIESRDEAGLVRHYVRVRTLRGKACDTRWRRFRFLSTGEITLDPERDLGVSGWLKGRDHGRVR